MQVDNSQSLLYSRKTNIDCGHKKILMFKYFSLILIHFRSSTSEPRSPEPAYMTSPAVPKLYTPKPQPQEDSYFKSKIDHHDDAYSQSKTNKGRVAIV